MFFTIESRSGYYTKIVGIARVRFCFIFSDFIGEFSRPRASEADPRRVENPGFRLADEPKNRPFPRNPRPHNKPTKVSFPHNAKAHHCPTCSPRARWWRLFRQE